MLDVYRIAHNSKIYGPYSRDVIWFKGCTLHCKNCINPELWSSNNPNLLSINSIINQLQSKHITLLGGEPLQQKDIFLFIKELKNNNIGIILFTGYEQNELSGNKKKAAALCDVVIYGRYIDKLKDDSLYLRGSTNQEIVFNTSLYMKNDFHKANTYELNINKELELHGRTKNLINELLDL